MCAVGAGGGTFATIAYVRADVATPLLLRAAMHTLCHCAAEPFLFYFLARLGGKNVARGRGGRGARISSFRSRR